MRKRIGELLIEAGVISEAQLQEALERGKVTGQRLGDALINLNIASKTDIFRALSTQLDLPVVDLVEMLILPSAVEALPESLARRYSVIPVDIDGSVLTVASSDPTNVLAEDAIRFATGRNVKWVLAYPDDISRALERAYTDSSEPGPPSQVSRSPTLTSSRIQARISPGLHDAADMAQMSAADALNSILEDAVARRASYIHLAPVESGLRVRFDIDGTLNQVGILSKDLQAPMFSRLRVMSGLGITDSRIPEEGLGTFTVANKRLHYRLNVLPTLRGEKFLISLFDASHSSVTLDDLGFQPDQLASARSMLTSQEGVVLITGPMSSGKTTTLYAAINEVKFGNKDIITLEDPVESEIDWVNQVQINEKAGLTFPKALRAIIRQRPEVIMISDLRDLETAELAFRAAEGGQLILTSLRVTDAPSAISFLLHLGLSPYFIATALRGIISQRLVRKIHLRCRTTYTPDPETVERYGLQSLADHAVSLVKGVGCTECGDRGTLGRTGLFQILDVSPQFRQLILSNPTDDSIVELAQAEGLHSFHELGLARAIEGVIPIEEVPPLEPEDGPFNLNSLVRHTVEDRDTGARSPVRDRLQSVRELVTV